MRPRITVCKCASGHVVATLAYDADTLDTAPAAALSAEMDGDEVVGCWICGDRQRRFCELLIDCLTIEDARRNADSMLDRQREARDRNYEKPKESAV